MFLRYLCSFLIILGYDLYQLLQAGNRYMACCNVASLVSHSKSEGLLERPCGQQPRRVAFSATLSKGIHWMPFFTYKIVNYLQYYMRNDVIWKILCIFAAEMI